MKTIGWSSARCRAAGSSAKCLKSPDPRKSINVMRVPHYPTIDPHTYDAARDGGRYGTGMQRRLMSGYMGHFVAFPHFAAASEAELAHDYGQHGEAIAVEWKVEETAKTAGATTLRYSAALEKTRYRMERTITLPADETVTVVRRNGSTPRDHRVFSGTVGSWLLDGGRPFVYFTMYNTEYPVLIGYVFETAPNRWVLDWQENGRMQEKPWNGKVVRASGAPSHTRFSWQRFPLDSREWPICACMTIASRSSNARPAWCDR